MKADLTAACVRVAATQHGVIALRQTRALGLSKHAVHRLVESGAWMRLRPCVYSLWTPSSPDELWLHRLWSASLWLGDAAAITHRAASLLYGIDGVNSAPLEFSTTGRRRASDPGLIVHETAALPTEEVVGLRGLRVTSVPRTIVDLASVAGPATLEIAVEWTLRSGQATLDSLSACLDRAPRNRRGSRALREILAAQDTTVTESILELIVWQILREAGLPPPIRQHEIRNPAGRLVARADFAYPEVKLAIEADGIEFHSSSRDLRRDRAKHNALTRLGWTIYRITWRDAKNRRDAVGVEVVELLRECRRRTAIDAAR